MQPPPCLSILPLRQESVYIYIYIYIYIETLETEGSPRVTLGGTRGAGGAGAAWGLPKAPGAGALLPAGAAISGRRGDAWKCETGGCGAETAPRCFP